MNDTQLQHFKINDVTFYNVSFNNVSFDSVIFNGTEFIDCQFSESRFSRTLFNATDFNRVEFDSVSLQYSSICPLNYLDVEVRNFMSMYKVSVGGNMVENRTFNGTSPFDGRVLNASLEGCELEDKHEEIKCDPPKSTLYRDSFIISASGIPGNIASAFAVYFFPRNYWLGEFSPIGAAPHFANIRVLLILQHSPCSVQRYHPLFCLHQVQKSF